MTTPPAETARGAGRSVNGSSVQSSLLDGPDAGARVLSAVDAPRPEPSRRRLPRWLVWLRPGIQSKLLVMLLVTSVVSALVVGYIGYNAGRNSLRTSALQRLQNVRESRSVEITRYFNQLRDSLVIYTRGSTAVEAAKAFTAGFDQLQSSTVTPAQTASLDRYYNDVFIKGLDANQGNTFQAAGFEPTSNAQRYLQVHYTAPHASFDDAIKVDDAKDGSAWSSAHATYHDYFRELVNRFRYDDALLLDTRGNVVYSAYKGVDLGTNINTGPYRGSELKTAYQAALTSNSVDYAGITDFDRYLPSNGVPTAWALSPIGQNGAVSGVLALQIPPAEINDIMTGAQKWAESGLGLTGETYLVGRDHQMRSVSREVLENPAQYQKEAVGAGLAPDLAAKAARVKGTVLIQTVNSVAAQRALDGQTGVLEDRDYLGQPVLTAYTPLRVQGLDWALVAEVDTAEAYQPVAHFTRDIALATAAIIFLVCVASLLLAQVFVRPVRRLLAGVHEVASGNLDARVHTTSDDEFGELAGAFNAMASSLRTKQDLIEEQQRENDRLLLNLMPESVARRYRGGEETISEEHQDVSVLYADLQGFDEFSAQRSSSDSVALLNELVRQFDDSAARFSVDKLRTQRGAYLASCGMTVPRVDNARRILSFAQDMVNVVEQFNARHGSHLAVRAGVDTGSVTSGLVGRSSVVYDMWGDAVNVANKARTLAGQPGVYATQRVVDKVGDIARFTDVGQIDAQSGSQRVWRLEELS